MELGQRERRVLAGAAEGLLAPGVSLLEPAETVLEAMIEGWVIQQQSRLLSPVSIEKRQSTVRRFVRFTNEYPWVWTPADVEEWTASMVADGLSHATIRNYQQTVALFVAYVCDRRYGWAEVCEARFGSHPTLVFHEWNTAVHRNDTEGRPGNRPFSREELQRFFDYCDERVAHAQGMGRKGWLAAFRDAVLFKSIYAWGLRRREAAMLDVVDWAANARAPEFGRFGVLSVRYGKATRGSPPRRRSVLTTMRWASEAVAEWVDDVRPAYGRHAGPMLWPTERGGRISPDQINARFAAYRDALGLDPGLRGPHCLRHAYVTHLLEDGWDHLFIQQQVGHAWGSTTAVYTAVSSDFRNQALRRALDRAFQADHDEEV
jgi:site-specific recombinase XerD